MLSEIFARIGPVYGELYRKIAGRHMGSYCFEINCFLGKRRRFYSFTEEAQLNIDYIMPSFWCEHAAEYPFNKEEMFALKTDTGRITLDGLTFIFLTERT